MADANRTQLEIAERLQLKLLVRFERLLDSGEMSATDAATLSTLLRQNGWNLDPTSIPTGIRDKLRDLPGFDEEVDGEAVWADA